MKLYRYNSTIDGRWSGTFIVFECDLDKLPDVIALYKKASPEMIISESPDINEANYYTKSGSPGFTLVNMAMLGSKYTTRGVRLHDIFVSKNFTADSKEFIAAKAEIDANKKECQEWNPPLWW